MSDLIKTILGSSAVVAVLASIVAGIIKVVQNRMQNNRDDDLDDRSWVELYRSYVEEHLIWDNEMRADILQLRRVVDELRSQAKMTPMTWPVIPAAPKLFPKKGGGGTDVKSESTHPQ